MTDHPTTIRRLVGICVACDRARVLDANSPLEEERHLCARCLAELRDRLDDRDMRRRTCSLTSWRRLLLSLRRFFSRRQA